MREPDEWASGHVAGATHIPMNDVPARADELPTDQPVFVICRSGNRSRQVVEHLRGRGITAVNVTEGTAGWAGRGWPLEH
ncbi:MAG: rhodanese-like domain-containing protein [Nocardioides sp.]|nr:rhodanese-like domain-containing protein [Nocardioides sp.]